MPNRTFTSPRRALAHPRDVSPTTGRLTVLLVHNRYQLAGGEGAVFDAESALLERHGYRVIRYERHNDEVDGLSRLELAKKTVWNRESHDQLLALMRAEQPAIVHVHNTLPLISPAVYDAAREAGVPVVQTLHNYRLLCPNALFLREGSPCEKCLGKAFAWPGVVHGCYRDSRPTTAAVAGMVAAHRARGTWTKKVDRYIALTEFARAKLIQGGLPADKITVKPHFVDPDPGPGTGEGGYALYAGRLSEEKGIETLIEAWTRHRPGLRLKVIGDGPLLPLVESAREAGVEAIGRQPLDEVIRLMQGAAVVVIPSICYETFGRTAIEAYAAGTPVIVSDGGAVAELVRPGETGFLFPTGNADALAGTLTSFLAARDRWPVFRHNARAEFEAKYTGPRNAELLRELYASLMATSV